APRRPEGTTSSLSIQRESVCLGSPCCVNRRTARSASPVRTSRDTAARSGDRGRRITLPSPFSHGWDTPQHPLHHRLVRSCPACGTACRPCFPRLTSWGIELFFTRTPVPCRGTSSV